LTTKNIAWEKFTSGELRPDPDHNWFDPEEIRLALIETGFRILDYQGLLPREGKLVEIEQSHSIIIRGEKI
jgi:hypothetical protein